MPQWVPKRSLRPSLPRKAQPVRGPLVEARKATHLVPSTGRHSRRGVGLGWVLGAHISSIHPGSGDSLLDLSSIYRQPHLCPHSSLRCFSWPSQTFSCHHFVISFFRIADSLLHPSLPSRLEERNDWQLFYTGSNLKLLRGGPVLAGLSPEK